MDGGGDVDLRKTEALLNELQQQVNAEERKIVATMGC